MWFMDGGLLSLLFLCMDIFNFILFLILDLIMCVYVHDLNLNFD